MSTGQIVPAGGKVWELDGLRAGPLEVGDIPEPDRNPSSWLDVVRPAIRMKMESLQGHGGGNLRFNLLALVEGGWERRSDEFELLRREYLGLERNLEQDDPKWQDKVSV